MHGLREIRKINQPARDDNVRRVRRNAIEWFARARAALEAGDYEICAHQARAAAKEVETLVPVRARVE